MTIGTHRENHQTGSTPTDQYNYDDAHDNPKLSLARTGLSLDLALPFGRILKFKVIPEFSSFARLSQSSSPAMATLCGENV